VVSGLRVHSPGLPNGVTISARAIAAHGDSILAKIETRSDARMTSSGRDEHDDDYFIYYAGDAAATHPSRPPSLSLLPPCYLTEQDQWWQKKKRYMDGHGVVLVRRGGHGEN
jgi:hypothetical protein